MHASSSKVVFIALAALALPSMAQVTQPRAPVTAPFHLRQVRTPYTAEFKITRIEILANGTTITHEDTDKRALDSHGRQMFTSTAWLSQSKSVTNVTVVDPVAHTLTHWNSLGTRATIAPMNGPVPRGCRAGSMESKQPATRPAHETPVLEDLGTDTIQGIEARGTRTTTTIAVGEIGNDVALVTTTERWVAVTPGMKGLMLRELRDDPRWGRSSRELTSLTQGEPDPALFQPPSNYEIVTEEVSKGSACPAEDASKPAEDASKGDAPNQ